MIFWRRTQKIMLGLAFCREKGIFDSFSLLPRSFEVQVNAVQEFTTCTKVKYARL